MKTKILTLLLLFGSTTIFAQGPWFTTGNATVPTNFLGTTNNQPLNFRTNNTQRMSINGSNGNVAIGLNFSTPQNLLHLHNGRNSFAQFTNANTGSGFTDGLLVGIVDGGLPFAGRAYLNQQSNFPMDFFTNGTRRMTLLNGSGNLGIGTNFLSPVSLLHLNAFGSPIGDLIRTDGDEGLRNQWQLFSGPAANNLSEKGVIFTDPTTFTQAGGFYPSPLKDAINDAYNHLTIQSTLGDIIFRANGTRNPTNSTENGSVQERMRISTHYYIEPNLNVPTNPMPVTRVSISASRGSNGFPVDPIIYPLSMLHIGDASFPNWGGHRAWMNWGTFIGRYDDMMFVGMRQNEDPASNNNADKSDAVIVWGDNPRVVGDAQLDHFRIIFNSAYSGTGAAPGQSNHFNGLEAMRITPLRQAGVIGPNAKTTYIGFGDFSSNNQLHPLGEPARRIEVLSDKITAANDGTPQIRITNHKQDPSNSAITGRFAELHDVQTGDLGILAYDNTLSQANNSDITFSERFVGINTISPGNTFEINSQYNNSATLNGQPIATGFGNPTGWAGLRFKDLSSGSTPQKNPGAGVLSIDKNGDVIYVPQGGTTGLGNYCGAAPNPITSDYEIPLSGNNFHLTDPATLTYAKNSLLIGNNCAQVPDAKVNVFSNVTSGNPSLVYGLKVYHNNLGASTPFGGISYASSFEARNNNKQNVAVYGASQDGANNVGGYFITVMPQNGTANSNNNGVIALAGNGLMNKGIDAQATGGTRNIGGDFQASGGTQYNYAVHGIAPTVSNSWAGYFDGNVNVNGTLTATVYGPSDALLKTAVDSLEDANSIISQLKPKQFYFDTTNVYGINFSGKKQYGLIAQDVQSVLPELVNNVHKPADSDSLGNIVHPALDYKTVNYNALFAIMLKGMQEQQEKIEQLENAINNCCIGARTTNNSGRSVTMTDVELSDKNVVVLNQNVPNPFAEQTTITYNIPEISQYAQIIFNDMKGQIIKVIDIKTKGKGQLNVFANDLSSGMYTYSLHVDGKLIDTKKMLKTQ